MRKVLIIDGETEFLEMARSFLQAANIMVATADCAEAGRKELRAFKPNLILLSRDLLSGSGRLIPDGLELLREVKTGNKWKKTPVILLVSGASPEDLDKIRLLKYKAEDYACKPIADNELLRKIENLIGFDPDETTGVLLEEKDNFSVDQILAGSGDNPEFEQAARNEIKELLTRLGEEVIQTRTEGEDRAETEGASGERVAAEFELLQDKLQSQEKRFAEMRAKSAQAIKVLEARVKDLASENQALAARLSLAEAAARELTGNKARLWELAEKARELISQFENLKQGLDKELIAARDFLRELELLKK